MSIDDLVLSFLRRRPYSKPREIADSLGISVISVRHSLLRLRERGLVVRTSRGYAARTGARAVQAPGAEEMAGASQGVSKDLEELKERVSELEKALEDALENLSKLEKEVSEMRIVLKALQAGRPARDQKDPFLERISQEKIMTIPEARKEAAKHMGSLEHYIDKGRILVIGDLVVERSLYESLISRMPIRVEDMNRLAAKERILVEAMISEGILFIDRGREIKPVEGGSG